MTREELLQRAALAMYGGSRPEQAWKEAEALVAEGERRGHVQTSGAGTVDAPTADVETTTPAGGPEEAGTISMTGYKYPPAEEVTRYVVKITRRQESLVPLEDYEAAYRAQVERETEARILSQVRVQAEQDERYWRQDSERNTVAAIVEGLALTGPSPIGPMHAAGWNDALKAVADMKWKKGGG